MNKNHRSIYDVFRNTYVAVAENVYAKGKSTSGIVDLKNTRRSVFALGVISASVLYPSSAAWASCMAWGVNGVKALNDGSMCVTSGNFTSGLGTAVVVADSGASMLLDAATSITATNQYGVLVKDAGSYLGPGNAQKLTINTSGDDDNGIFARNGGAVNLGDINVTTTGSRYAQGVIAENDGKITINGQAEITTTGTNTTPWQGNEGVASNQAMIDLYESKISTSGDYSTGVVAVLNGQVGLGQASISTQGKYADGIAVFGGGNVFSNGVYLQVVGPKYIANAVSTTGVDSAAIRAANFVESKENSVNLVGYKLSSANANVIEVNGGKSNIIFDTVNATAVSGKKLLNVDDGTALAASGFHDVFKLAPNPSTLTLKASYSNLAGDMFVADNNVANVELNESVFSGATTDVTNLNLYTTTWNVTGGSTISQSLTNSGVKGIAFQGAAGKTITVGGNYTGQNGALININTVLAGDNSTTDKLHVKGDTLGSTQLKVTNVGGTGAKTINGINVVQVDGSSAAGSFSLSAPVQAGSYEYTLKQGSTTDANDWYLTSQDTSTPICITMVGANCDHSTPIIDIYRPGVAAYIAAGTANNDAGYTLLSSLHQRISEQRSQPSTTQTWGRVSTAGQSNNGSARFEYDQRTTGLQIGRDLIHNDRQRAGISINYSHSGSDARDRVRSTVGLAANTGTISSDAVGLGAYYTHMAKDGTYLDFVGQASHLKNHFSDSYGGKSKQTGWQVGVSAEVGKPVANLKGWSVEPQAQLSYLFTKYSDFNDQYSRINMPNSNQLKARLGLRFAKDVNVSGQAAQYYGVVNVGHDFSKSKSVNLQDLTSTSSATASEGFDRSYMEAGVGIQGSVAKMTDVYADARYQRSFKGNKEGAQFNVGVKFKF